MFQQIDLLLDIFLDFPRKPPSFMFNLSKFFLKPFETRDTR